MSGADGRAVWPASWLRLGLRLPVRLGCALAALGLRIGFRRNSGPRFPKAIRPPTIVVAGSDNDTRNKPVQSPKISPAHRRRSPPAASCHAPSASTDRSSARLPRETGRKTTKLNETQRISLICTEELAGRPTAELARVWEMQTDAPAANERRTGTETQGNTIGVRDETRPRWVTPGGAVGRRARESLPALLLPLLVDRAPCETIPMLGRDAAAARRQASPGNRSRARRLAHRRGGDHMCRVRQIRPPCGVGRFKA